MRAFRSSVARPLLLALPLALPIVNHAPARAAETLTLDAIFADEGHARAPSEIAWTAGGDRVAFLWSAEGARDLWWMAPETDSEPSALLRAGEVKDGDREIPFKDYVLAPDGSAFLFQRSGVLYLYRVADKSLTRLGQSEEKSEDPRFSPDSKRLAFVRAADLWVVDLATGEERRLTRDGREGHIWNGKPDWVYWEEIWHRDSVGFWWSPDSRRIAYMRFDEEGVPRHPLVHDAERDPTVESQPYPKPGDRNPTVTLGVLDLASGETVWMETGIDPGEDYIARVRFVGRGERLAVITLEREQNQADLVLCQVDSGRCQRVLRETLETWVDVGDDWEMLEDGRVLWGSDREGWRRLYLRGRDGEPLRAVSPEGVAVTKLNRVVEESGAVFFTGFRTAGLGAKDRQLYRVSLEGEDAELLAPACASEPARSAPREDRASNARARRSATAASAENRALDREDREDRGERRAASARKPASASASGAEPTDARPRDLDADADSTPRCEPAHGTVVAEVAPGGRWWIATHSTASSPPRASLARAGGAPPLDLPFAPATAYDRDALPQWEFLTIDAPDGVRLPARMMKPPGFDERRRYPVIMFHYGGPASQMVEDASAERPMRTLWQARQAQRGYVVIESDNPASMFFGKRGADRLHRRFGELELASQLAVAAHLEAQPWVDPDRFGLWGWSGGGANTLYAMFKSPGTWRAAVAGAPVTDWRLYDSIWTERYLDSPSTNEDGYRESSAITWASKLADHLLIVHGTGDDNVHPQNTFVLTRELVKAGLPFEQAIYPGEKHAFGDDANRHFFARMEEFFDRWLAPAGAK